MNTTPRPDLPWPIPYTTGVLPIAESEGLRLTAYQCIAGKWTCGWGETDGITPATAWTKDYADQRFCDSLTERVHHVRSLCTSFTTDNELSALVSLSYNIGVEGLAGSSVMKAHNRGDHLSASRAFSLWNKYRDPETRQLKESAGLTARRAREAALYLQADREDIRLKIPQVVEAETSVSKSPIAQSGAATAGVGALAAITQAGDQVSGVKTSVEATKSFVSDTLGVPTDFVLPAILVAAGGWVLWHRYQQRAKGWA